MEGLERIVLNQRGMRFGGFAVSFKTWIQGLVKFTRMRFAVDVSE